MHLSIDSNIAMWAEAHHSCNNLSKGSFGNGASKQQPRKPFCRLLTHQSSSWSLLIFLLCSEWLWCDYNCHYSLMIDNSHVRHSILAFFFFVRYGHKASWDFHAAYFWFCWSLISFPLHHLFCIALSSHWFGKRGWCIGCCLSVSVYTCMLPFLCLPIWRYTNGYMFHDVYTSSFIRDKDWTHIWYTNLIIYKNKEAR